MSEMEIAKSTGPSTSFDQDRSFEKDGVNKTNFCDEDIMTKSLPVNFSPAKYAFFFNDTSKTTNSVDSLDKFQSDKASFFRTDILLSPKYRGKVSLFDSSFEDYETHLTKIDSVPIKSEESLEDLTLDSSGRNGDLNNFKNISTLCPDAGFISGNSDHSIFTLISPSKFLSKLQSNRLSNSSESNVDSGEFEANKIGISDEKGTTTSNSFHDASKDDPSKSGKCMLAITDNDNDSTLENKLIIENEEDKQLNFKKRPRLNSFDFRRLGNKTANLMSRFSKSQETYNLQGDTDDSSDLDSSRNEECDDSDSVAISLDPMDHNFDSNSLMSSSTESCVTAVNATDDSMDYDEVSTPIQSTEVHDGNDFDDDMSDVINDELVSFVRNFDSQASGEGTFQTSKASKLANEKIPSDDTFALQSRIKQFKKNFQPAGSSAKSPTAATHQVNFCRKHDNCISPDSFSKSPGSSDSSPVSPSVKFVSVATKNLDSKSFQQGQPSVHHETSPRSSGICGSKSESANPECAHAPASAFSKISDLLPPEEEDGNANSKGFIDVPPSEVKANGMASGEAENETAFSDESFTAFERQQMLLADFRSFSQRVSRESERPSAARLAKRLFFLQGFRKTDITRHLSKRNSFAVMVGEEYLKHFDFTGEMFDQSLRIFLRSLAFAPDFVCDKDQLIQHFAHRYLLCNPSAFSNRAVVHSLACALLSLDNEFNNQTYMQRLTAQDFVDNYLDSLANSGVAPDLPSKEFVHQLYQSIRDEPLKLQIDEAAAQQMAVQQQLQQQQALQQQRLQPAIPSEAGNVLQLMTAGMDKNSIDFDEEFEFKKGYIMRKCCLDSNGRKTGLGRRGWKMFYAVLCNTTLYLYPSERASKYKKLKSSKNSLASSKNSLDGYDSMKDQLNMSGTTSNGVSTPKKTLGNALKSKVLGKFVKSSRSRTGSLDSSFSNAAATNGEDGGGEKVEDDEDDAIKASFDADIADDKEDRSAAKCSSAERRSKDAKTSGEVRTGGSPSSVATAITNGSNSILILHALATKATDYVKKSHVFRLHTFDHAQYLIQTSDMKECQSWMDFINIRAALNSSAIPDQYFDGQKRFNRLPISALECSNLSVREQIAQHEKMVGKYEKLLIEYRKSAPEKGSRNRIIRDYCDRENFLKFETKRLRVYIKFLQYHLNSNASLEPSLVETVIGEVEEPCASPREEGQETLTFFDAWSGSSSPPESPQPLDDDSSSFESKSATAKSQTAESKSSSPPPIAMSPPCVQVSSQQAFSSLATPSTSPLPSASPSSLATSAASTRVHTCGDVDGTASTESTFTTSEPTSVDLAATSLAPVMAGKPTASDVISSCSAFDANT